CVVLTEHLANQQSPQFISNFDSVLTNRTPQQLTLLQPTLLITLGGHLVSKRLKQFLRHYPAQFHWQITPYGDMVDISQHVTQLIVQPILSFLQQLTINATPVLDTEFKHTWFTN